MYVDVTLVYSCCKKRKEKEWMTPAIHCAIYFFATDWWLEYWLQLYTVEYIFSNWLMTWILTPAIHCGMYFQQLTDDWNTDSSYTLWNIFSAIDWWLEYSIQLYTVEYIFSNWLLIWILTPTIHCGIWLEHWLQLYTVEYIFSNLLMTLGKSGCLVWLMIAAVIRAMCIHFSALCGIFSCIV